MVGEAAAADEELHEGCRLSLRLLDVARPRSGLAVARLDLVQANAHAQPCAPQVCKLYDSALHASWFSFGVSRQGATGTHQQHCRDTSIYCVCACASGGPAPV